MCSSPTLVSLSTGHMFSSSITYLRIGRVIGKQFSSADVSSSDNVDSIKRWPVISFSSVAETIDVLEKGSFKEVRMRMVIVPTSRKRNKYSLPKMSRKRYYILSSKLEDPCHSVGNNLPHWNGHLRRYDILKINL